jgi:ribosomal protein S18 acetylase RimI-like enzyme
VDGKWADAQIFFERLGFRRTGSAVSASLDLTRYAVPAEILRRSEDLSKDGIVVRAFSPADRGPLLRFALSHFGLDAHDEVRCHMERVRHGFNRCGMDWSRTAEPDGIHIAADRHRIVGYSICSSRLRKNLGAVEFVGVMPSLRSRGIGGVLMAKALETLENKGLAAADMWTDREAGMLRWCCSSLGFRVYGMWLVYELPLK